MSAFILKNLALGREENSEECSALAHTVMAAVTERLESRKGK